MQYTKIKYRVTFEATSILEEFTVQAQAKITHDLKEYFSNNNVEQLVSAKAIPQCKCSPNISSTVEILEHDYFEGTHLISVTDKFVIHLMDKAFEDEEPCLVVDAQTNQTHIKCMNFEFDDRYNCERVKLVLIDKKPYIKYKDDFKLVRKLKGKK